jgi:arylsulfatase A-like enzyme
MSDDHGYQAISAYDGTLNKTPNIDRLADEGIRFTQSFVTNSICAPSRAVMLTGTYNNINGVINNSIVFDSSQITYPKLLRQAGYQTALFGKWHLKSPPSGFEYWSVLPGQGDYYNPDFITMGKRERKQGYVTDLITDEFIKWMENRNKEKPFCVLLHNKAPHRNWMPDLKHISMFEDKNLPVPETFYDDYKTRSAAAKDQRMSIAKDMYFDYDLKYTNYDNMPGGRYLKGAWKRIHGRLDDNEMKVWDSVYDIRNTEFEKLSLSGKKLAEWKYQRYIKDYLRCIASVDDNIGRVLDYLDKNGLKDNTIVIYTSDQGFYLGEHGWFDKRFMYEQSFRTPLIVRYPDKIKPGIDSTDLVMNLDYAPTLLDFAGVPVPEKMQGISMKDILENKKNAQVRDAIYYHYFEYPNEHMVKRHYGIRTDRYKLIHFYYDIDAWELYDLKNDPDELNNLYNNKDYEDIITSLKNKLQKLREQYNDTDESRYLPKPPLKVNNVAKGAKVIYVQPYSNRYPGGGDKALTDGLCAPETIVPPVDYKNWQGFQGNDMEVIINLKKDTDISEITAGFLQSQANWIFLPKSVKYEISTDGENYDEVAFFKNKNPVPQVEVRKAGYSKKFDRRNVRYIKITAKNIGTCPVWHKGNGKKAWLFCDEVVIN